MASRAAGADYTFAVDDYGVHVFCRDFRLKTVGNGSQTVTISDTVDSFSDGHHQRERCQGEQPDADRAGGTTAGDTFTVTVTAFDQYGNIATGYHRPRAFRQQRRPGRAA